MTPTADRGHMKLAMNEAKAAGRRGEVPIGAVIVDSTGRVLAADGNRTIELSDPTAHAEVLVIRKVCATLNSQRLGSCDLYVTLEPCPMCAAAISFARIRRLYYAASDPKGGGVAHGPRIFSHPTCNHRPEIYDGIDEEKAAALLRDFFSKRR